MLGTLHLQKFRGFETYALNDLTRVNLLVGKNNCGKTSILEAIHFLVSRGDPSVLLRMAIRRGELNGAGERAREREPNISHFFFGRRLEPGAGFRLSTGDLHGHVAARIGVAERDDETPFFEEDVNRSLPLVLQVDNDVLDDLPNLPVSKSGLISLKPLRFRNPWSWSDSVAGPPLARFVATDSLDIDSMRAMWDKVLLEGREAEIVDAVKLLENDLESIHFTSEEVLLGFRGAGRRAPLGSHGDGMRRLLALSLSLIQTAEGYLLVDEIDTGMYWTVMEDMWRLVVDTARKSSVQVFATTHSYDCIRGLVALAESRPDIAGEVSIHKMERALHKAVRFAEDDIPAIGEQNIEVR